MSLILEWRMETKNWHGELEQRIGTENWNGTKMFSIGVDLQETHEG